MTFLSLEERGLHRGEWEPAVSKIPSHNLRRVEKFTGHPPFRLGLGDGGLPQGAWNPGPRDVR